MLLDLVVTTRFWCLRNFGRKVIGRKSLKKNSNEFHELHKFLDNNPQKFMSTYGWILADG